MNKSVLIVGAGIGGLATALRLSTKGCKVTVLEKNEQAGGRLNQLKKDGFTFDLGPSFFSMSFEFEQFAKDCMIKLPFEYEALNPLYAVNFRNNPKYWFLYKDLSLFALQFDDIEPRFDEKINKYLKNCRNTFHDTINLVVKRNFSSMLDYFITLMRVNPFHLPKLWRSFWTQVNLYFSSAEAKQIISLVSFFLGRTPFDTPAIYSLLSYTEFQHDGYFNVKGGMYKIVEGLVKELKNRNVEIIYDTEIVDFSLKKNKIEYLIDNNRNKWFSDVFLINADAAVFRSYILRKKSFSPQRLEKMEWTMGYLTFYLGLNCKLPFVHHHNYFLGSNMQEYASLIFSKQESINNPYYYVNLLSKYNPECAPSGCESLFFVCPVPNLQIKPDWSDKEIIVDEIISNFSQRINLDIKHHIISKTIYTPEDWQNQFNLYKGSGLGLSHKISQIGWFRPQNFDEDYNNVFYVGASTVPGAGLPMAIISSKLAFERIMKYTGKFDKK